MNNNKIAAPLYYQQLEQSLNLNPLLNYVENLYSIPVQLVHLLIQLSLNISPCIHIFSFITRSSSDDTDDENEKLSAEFGEFSKKTKKQKILSKQGTYYKSSKRDVSFKPN